MVTLAAGLNGEVALDMNFSQLLKFPVIKRGSAEFFTIFALASSVGRRGAAITEPAA